METSTVSKKIFVEFLGLPGAGKTTIAREVLVEIDSQGFEVETRQLLLGKSEGKLQRILYGCYFVLRHPVSTMQIYRFCIRSGCRRRFFYLLQSFISQYRALQQKEADLVIYDQGIINAVLSCFGDIDFPYFARLYRSLYPDVETKVFFISLSKEEALERAQSRDQKGHFTERLNNKEILDRYKKYLDNYKQAQSLFNKNDLFKNLQINGNNKILDNVKFIKKNIINEQ